MKTNVERKIAAAMRTIPTRPKTGILLNLSFK
jgi:hypothetical protein